MKIGWVLNKNQGLGVSSYTLSLFNGALIITLKRYAAQRVGDRQYWMLSYPVGEWNHISLGSPMFHEDQEALLAEATGHVLNFIYLGVEDAERRLDPTPDMEDRSSMWERL